MHKKVLFISSSIGLGHAARDLTIAREIKRRNPDIEISWLAGNPAAQSDRRGRRKLAARV